MTRSSIGIVAATLLACVSSESLAQEYPTRPLRLLHGFAAGGNADAIARVLADEMSRGLGQPVVVEARAGAGGSLASDHTAKAAADGYTWCS